MGHYPRHRDGQVEASPSFPKLEEQTLAYWEADNTFQKSIDNRAAGENGSNDFVFYDGPPFANGLPHYGHLLTGSVVLVGTLTDFPPSLKRNEFLALMIKTGLKKSALRNLTKLAALQS